MSIQNDLPASRSEHSGEGMNRFISSEGKGYPLFEEEGSDQIAACIIRRPDKPKKN
jgi:hypothetical protein